MENKLTAPQDGAKLISCILAAAECGVSRSAWYKLVASGKAPRPVKLGRSTRWRRAELEAWIRAGCPPWNTWRTMNKEGANHV